jgi:hypothetical protein
MIFHGNPVGNKRELGATGNSSNDDFFFVLCNSSIRTKLIFEVLPTFGINFFLFSFCLVVRHTYVCATGKSR